MISLCPSIEKLEAFAAGKAPRVEKHVAKCVACQGVLALMIGQTGDGVEEADCAQLEVILATSGSGEIGSEDEGFVRRHAAGCEACATLLEALREESAD